MKIYAIRETVDGSIFGSNNNKWWSGNPFQNANMPVDERDWHLFSYSRILYSTNSAGVWGRYRRCISPYFWQIVKNIRDNGTINGSSSWAVITSTPLIQKFVATIQKEWPEMFDTNLVHHIERSHNTYIDIVVIENLELIGTEFGSAGVHSYPFKDYVTKSMKKAYDKVMNRRAAGQPVH